MQTNQQEKKSYGPLYFIIGGMLGLLLGAVGAYTTLHTGNLTNQTVFANATANAIPHTRIEVCVNSSTLGYATFWTYNLPYNSFIPINDYKFVPKNTLDVWFAKNKTSPVNLTTYHIIC